jgi:1,4-alpha-glucan branching enzyme
LGSVDHHLFSEGRHFRLWEKLGAHPADGGTHFAVWAPNAESVSVIGDFNGWEAGRTPLTPQASTGIWYGFVPKVGVDALYKFAVRTRWGETLQKCDPFAFRTELPPKTASVVHRLDRYPWKDSSWMNQRTKLSGHDQPLSVYEVHLASWMRVPEEGNRSLTYRELATKLADHVSKLGFTHVELMPVCEHPFGGSWGYQVSSYFAPTSRHGTPDDFRFFVDTLHQRGIGVLMDWVPAHFPTDAHALHRFDGSPLYEHADPRQGMHPDWDTAIFNYGRNEVRNFLIASALFWLDEYHLDGLRVDAVASMLYLDYSRKSGDWVPNRYGGRENLEAIDFLKTLNVTVQQLHPGTLMLAEESTAWPQVSAPAHEGGLGFTHKWNMGWMHDSLRYFERDPLYRRYHHSELTFGLLYAFSERFMLPLSHDEVVHMKGSLLAKMPGDDWQKFANLRALYGWMWAHPGKKLLFMGGEFGQWNEWNHDSSLDWHLKQGGSHAQLESLVGSLNATMRSIPALYERDIESGGFQWVQADMPDLNVYAFLRWPRPPGAPVLCVANLSPMVRAGYRVGVPTGFSQWSERLNTDDRAFGGAGFSAGTVRAEAVQWDGQPQSIVVTLPPLAVVWLEGLR